MKWLDNTALVIVIIGAVNWLLVGIFQFDQIESAQADKSVNDSGKPA